MPSAGGLSTIEDKTLCHAGQVSVGATPLRRLSRIEYNNMVRDLGLDPNSTQPADQFVTEQKIDTGKAGNFNTNAYAAISGTLMNQQYLEAAETLAANAVSHRNMLSSVPSPAPRRPTPPARSSSSADFANRAFRGQLDSRRVDGAAAALQRRERPVRLRDRHPGGHRGGADLAALPVRSRVRPARRDPAPPSRSARWRSPRGCRCILWRSLPDQTLIDAANGGQPATARPTSATQATRMLADAKAKDALRRLRRPVARHREHGRGDEGHAVQELDGRAGRRAALRDA